MTIVENGNVYDRGPHQFYLFYNMITMFTKRDVFYVVSIVTSHQCSRMHSFSDQRFAAGKRDDWRGMYSTGEETH